MKNLLILLILVLAAGCAGRPTPIPEMESKEAKLYSSKCGVCHSVPHPKHNTYRQWEHTIALMEKNMADKGMKTLMTLEERNTIINYLKRHAR